MSTFLDLVQDLARESGTLAGGVQLSTVASATGRADKLVSWTRKAWVNIQNERDDWPWMRREFSHALTIAQARYTAVDLGIATRFGQWIGDRPHFRTFTLYDPAIGKADEGEIREVGYDRWRMMYGRGAHDADRPTDWAVSPQQELCLGATPNKAYVLTGEYRAAPQILTADTDVPELPAQYHAAIVWEALKLLGMADEAQLTASSAISEYVLARQNLNRDFLPKITIGASAFA